MFVAVDAAGAEDLGPDERLGTLLGGFAGTQLLFVVAELRVADELAEGPCTIDSLADRVGAVPDVLYRFLRVLATYGVFEEDAAGSFRNTPASELLRQQDGSGWRDFAIVYGSVYRAFGEALSAARTGENMFSRVHKLDWWTWLEQNPQAGQTFNRAMQAGAQGRIERIVDLVWQGNETVVDIGGGNGTLVIELLRRHPYLNGVVFDLPDVADQADTRVADAALSDRCSVVRGSFFDEVPTGGDVYVLAKILHDWDNDAATKILNNVRSAAPDHARLLVIDSVVPAGNAPHPSKAIDLVMLSLVNGRERSEGEWRQLLEAGGFEPVDITDGLIQAAPN